MSFFHQCRRSLPKFLVSLRVKFRDFPILNARPYSILLITVLLLCAIALPISAQDSITLRTDSLLTTAVADSAKVSTSRIRREKVDLDHQVVFSCSDSMIMIGRNTAMMFGDSQVDYGDIS